MFRALACWAAGAVLLAVLTAAGGRTKPQLFVALPEFAVTPDGMAIAPDGDLVVACPNFASYPKGATRPSVPGCLLKIGKDRKVRKWVETPVLPETGRSCPMGIEFGPGGELYVVDNQNWPTGNGRDGDINQGRILRLRIAGDRIAETTVVAQGISHPNGLRYRDGFVYVTVSLMPKVKSPDGLMRSAVYRFPGNGREIRVTNTLQDPNLLAVFVTENRFAQYGADGIVFDSRGNLYVGNFGDGKIHRLSFDDAGKVASSTVFAIPGPEHRGDQGVRDTGRHRSRGHGN
jgi:hypothetical protein